MGEQPRGEGGRESENDEKQKYQAVHEALDEEGRIMAEMDKVFAATQNRSEAEDIILQQWAPLMDAAVARSGAAIKAWLQAVREAHQREQEV